MATQTLCQFRCVPCTSGGEHCVTPLCAPFEKQLPMELVARSCVLQNAVEIASSECGMVTTLMLPPCDSSFFDAWIQLVQTDEDSKRLMSLPEDALLRGLQVCSCVTQVSCPAWPGTQRICASMLCRCIYLIPSAQLQKRSCIPNNTKDPLLLVKSTGSPQAQTGS